jgi:hypothetical protein
MDERFLDHLREIHHTYSDQVRMADQKAAYIFTFMLALLIWSKEFHGVFTAERYATGSPPLVLVSIVAAVSLVVALLSAMAVVLPRRLPGGSSLFWGRWTEREPALMDAARRRDLDFLAEEYRIHIGQLAAICRSKYRFTGIAFRSLTVSVVAYVAMMFLV